MGGPAAGAGTGPSLPARPAGLGGAGGLARPAAATATAPAPVRPAAPAAPVARAPPPPEPSSEIVDPSENKKNQKIQARIQELRVQLVRAAGRLGLRYDSEQVQQFMSVIQRVETMAGAGVYKNPPRKVDLARAAEKTARELDSREAADSKLGLKVKVLLLGMSGTGKSELINALLERPAAKTSAFGEATKRVRVVRGMVHGVQLELIDTPGLHASSSKQAENRALLKGIRAAYRWHKPNYVFWVDRLDAGRPALGELSLLGLINEALGGKVWRETMVVLTHAHACRAALGAGYDAYSRQRRNIVMQLLRQAAGDAQVRNPMFVVDCHPSCPTNSFGQPVVLDGAQSIPWKQVVMMQLIGYRIFEEVQQLFRDAQKGAKSAAAAKQADLFKQLMRPRLPPVNFYVEQECEGVLKPDTWAAMDDPFGAETDDEEAEEFQHAYYREMYALACRGNPWAQKEYAAMLNRLHKLRGTYKDAFQGEDIEQLAAGGYEGYVTEGLDLGPTFDPEDGTNHRYVYAAGDSDIQIMPTLDYYGFEHEDAINGFVAEYDGQPGNRDGWGGFPLNLHLAVEKDKKNTCLQGEAHMSVIHNIPPWGGRHITQLNAAAEVLRPNIKDVLYQLEVNTFKDGLLARNDHAGVGLMWTRLGEGGRLDKGPMGYGMRLQDTLRLGAFKVEACAAKVSCDAQGGRAEAWGGRAFVHYDHLPGLGMIFDFYQQRAKDDVNIGGWASNFAFDLDVLGSAIGVEMDYVPSQQALHVDMNVYSGNDWKLGWVLLLPAVNYVKGMWAQWREGRAGGGPEMEMMEGEEGEEEEEEEEQGGAGAGAGLTPEQMQQMMRMMGMGR